MLQLTTKQTNPQDYNKSTTLRFLVFKPRTKSELVLQAVTEAYHDLVGPITQESLRGQAKWQAQTAYASMSGSQMRGLGLSEFFLGRQLGFSKFLPTYATTQNFHLSKPSSFQVISQQQSLNFSVNYGRFNTSNITLIVLKARDIKYYNILERLAKNQHLLAGMEASRYEKISAIIRSICQLADR